MRRSELSVLLLLVRRQVGFGQRRLVEAGRLLGSISKAFNPSRYSREKRRLKHTDSTSSQSRRH